MLSLQNMDQWLFQLINSTLANAFFDVLFPAITDLHKTDGFKFVFLPILFLMLLYFHRLRGLVITLGLAVSLGIGDKLGSIAKHFWQRPRPFEAGFEVIQRSPAAGFSFPSNHAVNMFCMAFFLSAFFPKGRWIFMTAATLVALSRVYNGVHYPFDIFIGGLLGSFCGILGAELTKRVLVKMNHKTEERSKNG